jgi:DNA processing protein
MDHIFWFFLRSVPLVGNVTFRRLLERFGSPEAVFRASRDELARVKGVSAAVAAAIHSHDGRPAAERECLAVRREGVRIVTLLDRDYPKPLLEIPDPPPYLYVKGSLEGIDPAVAVVGSRRASSYGILTTSRLAGELASRGVTVVSGMARGVDAAAHRAALEAGGNTIGVLGCGIDLVYPTENRELFREMADKGALVSEFPLGTLPLAENFPRRNRLISGISRGVLVVEAAENSGSLITAQLALDQGRDVFAVPGNINFSSSRGTNRLIKQGAKLVEGVEDILEELPQRRQPTGDAPEPPGFSLSPREASIYSLLADGPLHIDELGVRSELTPGEVSAMLLNLELKGAVIQLPGKHFSLA